MLERHAPTFAPLRLGIAWRLGIAFVGVSILAVAANLLVDRGIQIFEKHSAPSHAALPLLQSPAVTPSISERVVREVSSSALRAALARFESAALTRAQTNSSEADEAFRTSKQQFERAAQSFQRDARSIGAEPVLELRTAVKAYVDHATEMVRLADQRRAALREYWSRLETMTQRTKTSVDQAWKIFGRVVARQSLMQLSNDLNGIRSQFAEFSSSAISDDEDPRAKALVESEETFAAGLENNQKSLTRTQGQEWVRLMKDDASQLIFSRVSLQQASKGWRNAEAQFSRGTVNLQTLIPERLTSTQTVQEKMPRAEMLSAPVTGSQVALPSEPTTESNILVVKVSEQSTRARMIVRWLTGAVLLLLLAVSLSTVRSIVRPVRRMVNATAHVASGTTYEPLPPGGIKELDTLATAFNQMASEVLSARRYMQRYQQQLEGEVQERTEQLQELAQLDPLTSLPNRRQLFVLLNSALEAARAEGSGVGVLFLDIDNFKNINDSMGHAFGDRLLTAISKRLSVAVADCGFAARLGGDEFTVVVTRCEGLDSLHEFGARIVRAFEQPVTLDLREVRVSVSVGASAYPFHEQDAEGLLRAADAALFRAKALGRSQLSVFTPDLFAEAATKFVTEQGLRSAIEHGEFELVFQPEIDAKRMETALVEALIRWRLPDGRLASPGEFLAVAEQSGLIMQISDWVLRAGIEAAAQWHHGAWPKAKVALNMSSRQFLDNGFVDRVLGLLEEFRVPPSCIEIELTESVLQTGAVTIRALQRLRASGIAIALDDFGTGYSSLASLEQLPLSRIKLDRSLIAGIDINPRSAAIAKALITLCHDLGLDVTAEGIERPEQFHMLVGYPGMYLQGYLLSKPIDKAEVLAVMRRLEQYAPTLLLLPPAHDASVEMMELSAESLRELA